MAVINLFYPYVLHGADHIGLYITMAPIAEFGRGLEGKNLEKKPLVRKAFLVQLASNSLTYFVVFSLGFLFLKKEDVALSLGVFGEIALIAGFFGVITGTVEEITKNASSVRESTKLLIRVFVATVIFLGIIWVGVYLSPMWGIPLVMGTIFALFYPFTHS